MRPECGGEDAEELDCREERLMQYFIDFLVGVSVGISVVATLVMFAIIYVQLYKGK